MTTEKLGTADTVPAAEGFTARRIVALLTGITALIATAPACLVAISSVFVFDAPGSGDDGQAWSIAFGLLAAPVVTLATSVLGFLAAHRFTQGRGIAMVAVPGLYIFYLIAVFSGW